jgi:hypothetical protein
VDNYCLPGCQVDVCGEGTTCVDDLADVPVCWPDKGWCECVPPESPAVCRGDVWVSFDECGAVTSSKTCVRGCADGTGCCGEGTHAVGAACEPDVVETTPDNGPDANDYDAVSDTGSGEIEEVIEFVELSDAVQTDSTQDDVGQDDLGQTDSGQADVSQTDLVQADTVQTDTNPPVDVPVVQDQSTVDDRIDLETSDLATDHGGRDITQTTDDGTTPSGGGGCSIGTGTGNGGNTDSGPGTLPFAILILLVLTTMRLTRLRRRQGS